MKSEKQEPRDNAPRPDVIVDFSAPESLLYVGIKNIGARSAYRVVTTFDKPFHGVDGTKCITDLQLFRSLPFLPPGKEFLQFIDPLSAYFQRREPTRLRVTIRYADREGRKYEEIIPHDLRIYRDLGFTRCVRPD